MRLQSDIDALAAIEEDAKAMLKRIGLPDDDQKLEVVVFLRQIIDWPPTWSRLIESLRRQSLPEISTAVERRSLVNDSFGLVRIYEAIALSGPKARLITNPAFP
ncbi:hypothetical protein [Pseudomonas fluorescens]|uniref:hypothetical protein n=1 Tax=Pseudomonas fluorescens TaxID=294 RepID=UPI002B1D4A5E|nr:hypothetical protein [Pseudomonas fluorescens]